MDTVLAQLSNDTLDALRSLDLRKIKPQQLRDLASRLFHDHQITRDVASMLFSLGTDQLAETEFDALETLYAAQEFERTLPFNRFQTENLRLYRESVELTEGLRSIVAFLGAGHSLDVTV